MYSRQQASKLKQEFWTAFGQYMSPVLSAEGEKINWVNYKTGEKNINFRMDADNKRAVISIELSHTDPEIQQIYYHHFESLKSVFQSFLKDEWNWHLHVLNDYGKVISKIFFEMTDVNVFNKEDWPQLVSFFKSCIVALDEFWSNVKYGFEALK